MNQCRSSAEIEQIEGNQVCEGSCRNDDRRCKNKQTDVTLEKWKCKLRTTLLQAKIS